MITIQSIQIGRVITEGDPQTSDALERQWTTGFYKLPVVGPVQLTRLGLAGDAVADTRNHGGPDKAVLCYPASHYERWASEHPELSMAAGALGENLTVTGADEASVCIGDRYRVGDGDRYRVGDGELEVSQPRQPCWKIARRWGIRTLTKEVAQTGRTGWYFRVIAEGVLESGQRLELLDRPNPDWTVARANDIRFGREVDRRAVIDLMRVGALAEAWKSDLA